MRTLRRYDCSVCPAQPQLGTCARDQLCARARHNKVQEGGRGRGNGSLEGHVPLTVVMLYSRQTLVV